MLKYNFLYNIDLLCFKKEGEKSINVFRAVSEQWFEYRVEDKDQIPPLN